MSKPITVGMLREALKDVPDDYIVTLASDTGVDQPIEGGDIVVEDAYVVEGYKELWIYANEVLEEAKR